MEILRQHVNDNTNLTASFRPIFYRLSNQKESEQFTQLLSSAQDLNVYDEMSSQLRELIKSLHPSIKIKEDDYPDLIRQHLNETDISQYGVWVYYPWSRNLIHLLDREEFIEIRTNRNRYKITREEQLELSQRKIGVVGLSVGQSIALTLAMERTCGELRLADFDTVELSNLNRIRTGIQNLGLNKAIIAAREIAEIDPYIEVKIFDEGLTKVNIDQFFTGDGKIDLLVEVCDGLDIKIVSRFKARELGIPVVMDTNDRGMLDIERFDLEPGRPILHGLAEGLDPDNISGLSNEDKIPYILGIVGAEQISTRLKASMIEVEQSINTWPQLASSVVLGGAVTTDVCRRILLDQFRASGRYYVDIDELVGDPPPADDLRIHDTYHTTYAPLARNVMLKAAEEYATNKKEGSLLLQNTQLEQIMTAAIAAPSAGNNQPWKWLYKDGVLFLFHDKHISASWGDYFEMGAHLALGAALANVQLQAAALQLDAIADEFPLPETPFLIAAVRFKPKPETDEKDVLLAAGIFQRHTNRMLLPRQKLPNEYLNQLHYIGSEIGMRVYVAEDEYLLDELGEIIASCDRIRLLNKYGHEEFFNELRWTEEEALAKRDGVDLTTAHLTAGELAGFRIAKDWKAISLLSDWGKGNAFRKNSLKAAKTASAFVLFTLPDIAHKDLLSAGRVVERFWIQANQSGIAVHPMLSPVFFFNRVTHGRGAEMEPAVIKEVEALRERFLKIFPLDKDQKEVFLVKLSMAPVPADRSLRKNIDDIFFAG